MLVYELIGVFVVEVVQEGGLVLRPQHFLDSRLHYGRLQLLGPGSLVLGERRFLLIVLVDVCLLCPLVEVCSRLLRLPERCCCQG